MIVTKEDVTRAFDAGGFTINERFEETGFFYFPEKELTGQEGRDYPDQGRVFWRVEKHEYPDTPAGRIDKALDPQLGMCRDELDIHTSWGRPTDKQIDLIRTAIQRYVLYRRQQRSGYVFSFGDRRQMEEQEVEV